MDFLMGTARAYLKIKGMKYTLANEKVMLQTLLLSGAALLS